MPRGGERGCTWDYEGRDEGDIQRTRAGAECGNLSCTVAKASCCQEDLPGATKNAAARCKVAAASMQLEILACQSL